MRRVIVLLALMLTASSTLAGSLHPSAFDGYKGVKFGMTTAEAREAIEAVTGGEVKDVNSRLMSRWTLLSLDCFLGALMFDGKVIAVSVIFVEKHISPEAYEDDYDRIQKALESKFGLPDEHSRVHDYDSRRSFGMALVTGEASIYNGWWDGKKRKLATINVTHKLWGDNYKASHMVAFTAFQELKRRNAARSEDAFR